MADTVAHTPTNIMIKHEDSILSIVRHVRSFTLVTLFFDEVLIIRNDQDSD